jgi:adenylate kinase
LILIQDIHKETTKHHHYGQTKLEEAMIYGLLKARDELDLHGLDVRVFLQTVQAQFLAKARLLVATEGSALIKDIIATIQAVRLVCGVGRQLRSRLPVDPDSTGL